MSVAIITGSAGLIGSEAAIHFASRGLDIVGIDNDMRARFFGTEASTAWVKEQLKSNIPRYTHYDADIRDEQEIRRIVSHYSKSVVLVIHAAAQPSHDWAACNPTMDFTINANGTSVLLEATRRFAPEAVFVFLSTNKVYGDTPNRLPLVEMETRWELEKDHPYYGGIPETMSIDHALHSLFGVSKVAADVLVQEYGRYFGMKTACFRAGCMTGPNHSGTKLHGFLAYLMKCTATDSPYAIFGYKRKQVRDNIHSNDLVCAIEEFFNNPRCGEVYNIGGGRFSNCSMIEAIEHCEQIASKSLRWEYKESNRQGDHVWWISDTTRFQSHYPGWQPKYDVPRILREIYDKNHDRWRTAACSTQENVMSSAF